MSRAVHSNHLPPVNFKQANCTLSQVKRAVCCYTTSELSELIDQYEEYIQTAAFLLWLCERIKPLSNCIIRAGNAA